MLFRKSDILDLDPRPWGGDPPHVPVEVYYALFQENKGEADAFPWVVSTDLLYVVLFKAFSVNDVSLLVDSGLEMVWLQWRGFNDVKI
jgi:hypothetical protein